MNYRPINQINQGGKTLLTEENMQKIKCIFCDGRLLQADDENFQCEICKEKYPVISGLPYLYKYKESDILSLIEIAANKKHLTGGSPLNADVLKKWNDLMKEGLSADDHESYISTSPDWSKPWLEDRFREYVIFSRFIQGESLDSGATLDVGAGLGFDSYNIFSTGANVTAFEFSPVLAKYGKETIPEIDWLCGSAILLPFQNESFDFIFCNETLHHVNDVEKAIYEMLRVIKPGGCIFTISDSYSASSEIDKLELDIFNEHEAVLGGINESIVDLNLLTDIFDKYIDYLDIEAMAHISNSMLDPDSPLKNKFDEFGFIRLKYTENIAEIKKNFNGLSFKIKLKKPIKIIQSKLKKGDAIFEPKEYADSLIYNESMLNKLVEALPDRYIDLDLLNGEHNKFFLLNGLQKPLSLLPWRRAYKRLRLFFSSNKKNIKFSLSSCGKEKQRMIIKINGKEISKLNLSSKWISVDLDLSKYGGRSVVEFCLEEKENNPPFFLISSRNVLFLNLFNFNKLLKNIRNFYAKN